MSKIELVSRGDLDVYLTGNPSITFFKTVYRKHTNFSMEDIIVGSVVKPKTGNRYAIRIPIRTGDLLYKTELILKGNRVYCGNGIANISTAVIDNIVFAIASREIDRTYGHYLETWYELNQENPNNTVTNIARIEDSSLYHIGHITDQAVLAAMKCNEKVSYIDNSLSNPTNLMGSGLSYPSTQFQRLSKSGGTFCTPNYLQKTTYLNSEGIKAVYSGSDTATETINYNFIETINNRPKGPSASFVNGGAIFGGTPNNPIIFNALGNGDNNGDIIGDCILPLNFWFCRSPGLAIPLIALSNGVDVEMYIQFAGEGDAYWNKPSSINTLSFIKYDNVAIGYNNINNVYGADGSISPKTNSQPKVLPILDKNNNFNFNLDISSTYIFLDDMERRRFKNTSHEYLIEQLQFQQFGGGNSNNVSQQLDISSFHHPVKELIWTGLPYKATNIAFIDNSNKEQNVIDDLNNGIYSHISGVRYVTGLYNVLYGGGIITDHTLKEKTESFSYGFGNASYQSVDNVPFTNNPLNVSGKYVQGLIGPSTPDVLNYCNYKLVLNGNDRIEYKPLQYFTRQNLHKYHKGGCVSVPDSIAVYSFALDPTSVEPTGTCNFSKIESIEIMRDLPPGGVYKGVNVYAINYNILRFVNGQAGLTYVL